MGPVPDPISLSAASTLVAQATTAVRPIVAGRKPKPERRAEAYVRFQDGDCQCSRVGREHGTAAGRSPELSGNLIAAAVMTGPSLLNVPFRKQRCDWSEVAFAMAPATGLAKLQNAGE